mmetsp:Transcript_16382/g.18888  ORF Transcript_16382/g.18888 Transcript_16382/m.18888 type:complete len:295 (+) Transcript_16382:111-995(+)
MLQFDYPSTTVGMIVFVTFLTCLLLAIFSARSGQNLKNKLLFFTGSKILRLATCFMEKTIFTIDYDGGYNLNFECTYDELKSILPEHLEPVQMKILDNEGDGKYLFSLYCADLDLEGAPVELGRADAFTYVRDQDQKLGLCFISAFVDISGMNAMIKAIITTMNSFFGMDPYDYSLGYPHYNAEKIKISDNDFIFNVKDAKIHVSGEENIQSTGNLFHRDFVCANSQIYRGSNGAKNVNFFNQDFIDARVTSWDPKKISLTGNMADIHALCKKENLVSVQHYKNAGIRWYFENN